MAKYVPRIDFLHFFIGYVFLCDKIMFMRKYIFNHSSVAINSLTLSKLNKLRNQKSWGK